MKSLLKNASYWIDPNSLNFIMKTKVGRKETFLFLSGNIRGDFGRKPALDLYFQDVFNKTYKFRLSKTSLKNEDFQILNFNFQTFFEFSKTYSLKEKLDLFVNSGNEDILNFKKKILVSFLYDVMKEHGKKKD